MTKNQKALARLDALESVIVKLKHATDELDHDLDMLTGIIDEIIEPRPGKTLAEVFADEEMAKQIKDAENRAILEQFIRIHNVPDEAPRAGRRIHIVELQELTPEALFDVLGQVAAFEEMCNVQEEEDEQ